MEKSFAVPSILPLQKLYQEQAVHRNLRLANLSCLPENIYQLQLNTIKKHATKTHDQTLFFYIFAENLQKPKEGEQ